MEGSVSDFSAVLRVGVGGEKKKKLKKKKQNCGLSF